MVQQNIVAVITVMLKEKHIILFICVLPTYVDRWT